MSKTRSSKRNHKSWDHPDTKMYNNTQEYSACGKKSGSFGHIKEAMTIASSFENDGREWRAYDCPWCGKVHLTTKGIK